MKMKKITEINKSYLKNQEEEWELPKIGKGVTTTNPYTVFYTTNWSRFAFLKGNRPLKRTNINSLKESFKEFPEEPRIVKTTEAKEDGKYYITDGQNTYVACMELDKPFPGEYPVLHIVVPNSNIKNVLKLNNRRINWNRLEYIESNYILANPQYAMIYQLRDEFPQLKKHIYIYLACLNPIYICEGKIVMNKVHEGKFEIADYEKAQVFAQQLIDLKDKKIWNKHRFLITALGCMQHPEYDHKHMMSRIKQNYSVFFHSSDRKQIRMMVENCYNTRTTEMKKVYFSRLDTYKKE